MSNVMFVQVPHSYRAHKKHDIPALGYKTVTNLQQLPLPSAGSVSYQARPGVLGCVCRESTLPVLQRGDSCRLTEPHTENQPMTM